MRVRSGCVTALCVVLAASPAFAATTVQPGQGALYINQGQGFQQVTGPIEVNPGDQLMVSPGGAATAVYADGCRVSLQPGEVMTITVTSPCVNPYAEQLPPTTQTTDTNPWVVAGAGLVIAGALGYGIYAIVSASP